ncbi:MBL fold metallo-hydrolase [Paenibacillus sp. CAA11]|uniref:MBL fold metallo-hydrolase n=1 Tax=Paenibacillus sp. CAA11 TaxID=1532905 RepID=UPI000D349B63|nr:MBL fold metallo-hydrolase [Paenibacillus sp. CAA11]AWB43244.1 MBL fold metallo-hydrolase [Paenibacillus sp. CAA11]
MTSYHILDIVFDYNGQQQVIHPVLIQDGTDTILVDCGYPDFERLLEEAMAKYAIRLDSLNKLILTHHDMDHMGSAAALKRKYPHIEIAASEVEAPYVNGCQQALRLTQAEASLDDLPEAERGYAEQFIQYLKSIEAVDVDRILGSGERLPWCGGIEVVSTPGHTAGHISLYLPASRALIAGDAVVIEDDKLNIANPEYADHLEQAISSAERLLDYDIEQLVCYHGGRFQGDVKEALRELVREYRE